MSKLIKLFSVCVAATSLAIPTYVNAADKAISCSVAVDYVVNGTVEEAYQKDFVVDQGVPFVDDFSTRTRSKTFTATVTKDAGNAVVAIDYFNDVGVFHSVAFNTSLKMRGGVKQESTSGGHTFSASSAVAPASVSGNHETNYSLVCRRG